MNPFNTINPKVNIVKTPKYIYPPAVPIENRQWPDRRIQTAPRWCSVDLRDGNQSLPIPMNPEKKLQYFKMLVELGFKEIEVGFPSASQDDFDFVRTLIEGGHIPDDVVISVLTQARKHLIDRTVESLAGAKTALLHLYVATSDLHGVLVFNKDRDGVKKMAVEGTILCREALEAAGMKAQTWFEFSPEEFTDSDLDFTLEVCEAVKEAWGESTKQSFILNLPATVERRPPYQYADMIEYFCRKYKYLSDTSISLHAHNDQGCAVAASEMALLAGADRVEGTLFGHGERTGNLDLVTLALNLHSRGIATGLDFSNLAHVVNLVEETSTIDVHPRHPYAGQLVFTAFSGSHQDAIRKGLEHREKAAERFGQEWKVPYLHIDPMDVGRVYEKLIRINSQSGKGGVAYVLESEFGVFPPKAMHPEIGTAVQHFADNSGKEVTSAELYDVFCNAFVLVTGPLVFKSMTRVVDGVPNHQICVRIELLFNDKPYTVQSVGNGPVSASVNGLKTLPGIIPFYLEDFSEQTLGKTSEAMALAYVGIRAGQDHELVYGAGTHVNIDRAAVKAIFSAVNRAMERKIK